MPGFHLDPGHQPCLNAGRFALTALLRDILACLGLLFGYTIYPDEKVGKWF